MDRSAERVARNNAIFREANEGIEDKAVDVDAELPRVPFICECADERCTQLVPLGLPDYERVRADPRRFLHVPGHEASGGVHVQVVERHERYVVVEKVGEAGRLVEELDPRGGVAG
jgi:hypothetical protein